ncbi:MAG TPA: response regulator transcription factor [Thermodesulfobacteriota bacterium]|nr:response regulator transcription factor [Thermodesulfobacteriota bacterium]
MVRTLIVDDNAAIRILLKEILCERFPSMFVGEAVDEEEALEKAHLHLPDIIFMDIGLGGKRSGLELTRKIKADYPNSIIIVLTIYDLPEYREAAFQSGASYFLPKELLKKDDLLTLIESILSDLDEGVNGPRSADKTSKA